MMHLTFAAKTATLTDQGEARLLVSTYDKDRGGDVIEPGAFAESISQWQSSGRNIPVHFDHKGDPSSIVGAADPASMRETDQGLVVEAKLDLEDSETAREVWRLVKRNALACSFGYMADGKKLEDGTRLLTKIDLFEVTLTPSPMNPHTRVLSWKSASADSEPEIAADLAMVLEWSKPGPAEVEATVERKSRGPVQLATFDVECP